MQCSFSFYPKQKLKPSKIKAVALSFPKFRVYFLDRLHTVESAGTTAWFCSKSYRMETADSEEGKQKLRPNHGLIDYLKQEEVICFKVQELL